MRTLLIDSDVVAYQHSAAGERAYDFDGNGIKARVADPIEDCIERCREWMTRIKSELKADALVVCLSDPARNFRKDVLPTYKSNRAGTVKPEHLFPIKAWLQQEYRSFIRPTLEADDIMGILATHPKLIPGEKVIVSIDKDMGQIPGKWFNPKSGKMKRVAVEEGERLHYLQMLTGDPVDGYKGLPGCGPVKAAAILDHPCRAPWDSVVRAYEAKGLTADDALVQARVSRILQHTDYNFARKEPILWTPPQ
jgi:DNA polymerase-1